MSKSDTIDNDQSTIEEFGIHPKLLRHDEPVIRASGSERKIFHKPEWGEELKPDCQYDHADSYLVHDRQAIEGHYEPCSHCDWGPNHE